MLTTTDNVIDRESDIFINSRVAPHVRLFNASLEDGQAGGGKVAVVGRLDPNTLRFLKVDKDYQRPLGDRPDIYEALKSGIVVPSIDIGVRGQDFDVDGNDIVIKSPCFIVDGWQRVGTALQLLDNVPSFPLRIFATVHFDTDALWERHRFTELNKNVRKVSPNLHMRNMRDANPAVLTLYGLSNNTKNFALYKRVAWSQNVRVGELLTAVVLAKTAGRLHFHVASGTPSGTVATITGYLSKVVDVVGLHTFRHNVEHFFEVVDEAFGIRLIEVRHGTPHLKASFLTQLARVVSEHEDFWRNHELFVDADWRRKLSKFPVNDPHIRQLCGSGGASQNILHQMLIDHLNSGRRTGRLTKRDGV